MCIVSPIQAAPPAPGWHPAPKGGPGCLTSCRHIRWGFWDFLQSFARSTFNLRVSWLHTELAILTRPKPDSWLSAESGMGWGICPTVTGRAYPRLPNQSGCSPAGHACGHNLAACKSAHHCPIMIVFLGTRARAWSALSSHEWMGHEPFGLKLHILNRASQIWNHCTFFSIQILTYLLSKSFFVIFFPWKPGENIFQKVAYKRRQKENKAPQDHWSTMVQHQSQAKREI